MNYKNKWWLVPLVILVAIFFKAGFLTTMIAGKTDDAVTSALGKNGIADVSYVGLNGFQEIGRNGLDVTLEGPAENKNQAVQAVLALDEVNSVIYQATDTVDTATPPPAAPEVSPLAITVSDTEKVELTGVVKDLDTKEAFVSSAEKEYGAANVTDNLSVAKNIAGAATQVVVYGEAVDSEQQANWVTKATAVAEDRGVELVNKTSLRPVEESLNALFELNPIQFDKSRATIRATSIQTLDAAAAAIKANPDAGNFNVVGHTDSDGSPTANQALSQARAEAVVAYLINERGVQATRLDAEGRGETDLLVEPEVSSEDKQRNRRIEWELK